MKLIKTKMKKKISKNFISFATFTAIEVAILPRLPKRCKANKVLGNFFIFHFCSNYFNYKIKMLKFKYETVLPSDELYKIILKDS